MNAEESIRRVVATYVQRVDSGHIPEVVELFATDGVLEIIGQARHVGRDAISAMFARGIEHLASNESGQRIRHHLTSHLIEFDDPTHARSSCYWLAIVGNAGVDHWGRYVDRLVEHESTWQITERRIYLDGSIPGGWGSRGGEWSS